MADFDDLVDQLFTAAHPDRVFRRISQELQAQKRITEERQIRFWTAVNLSGCYTALGTTYEQLAAQHDAPFLCRLATAERSTAAEARKTTCIHTIAARWTPTFWRRLQAESVYLPTNPSKTFLERLVGIAKHFGLAEFAEVARPLLAKKRSSGKAKEMAEADRNSRVLQPADLKDALEILKETSGQSSLSAQPSDGEVGIAEAIHLDPSSKRSVTPSASISKRRRLSDPEAVRLNCVSPSTPIEQIREGPEPLAEFSDLSHVELDAVTDSTIRSALPDPLDERPYHSKSPIASPIIITPDEAPVTQLSVTDGSSSTQPTIGSDPGEPTVDEMLTGTNWLSDAAIDAALHMFCKPHVRCYSRGAVAAERLLPLDPEVTLALLPLRFPNAGGHWMMAFFYIVEREITVFDSLPGLVEEERLSRSEMDLLQFAQRLAQGNWTLKHGKCGKQENGYDCGVEAIRSAIYTSLGELVPLESDGVLWRFALMVLLGSAERPSLRELLPLPDHGAYTEYTGLRSDGDKDSWTAGDIKRVRDATARYANAVDYLQGKRHHLTEMTRLAGLATSRLEGQVPTDGQLGHLEESIESLSRCIGAPSGATSSTLPLLSGQMRKCLATWKENQTRAAGFARLIGVLDRVCSELDTTMTAIARKRDDSKRDFTHMTSYFAGLLGVSVQSE